MAVERFATVEEFEEWYAANSRQHYPEVTMEWLHTNGRRGAPCDCEYEECTGWQMLHDGELPGLSEEKRA
jgi:hypothetical protein